MRVTRVMVLNPEILPRLHHILLDELVNVFGLHLFHRRPSPPVAQPLLPALSEPEGAVLLGFSALSARFLRELRVKSFLSSALSSPNLPHPPALNRILHSAPFHPLRRKSRHPNRKA